MWYKELFLEHFYIKSTQIQLLDLIIEFSTQLIYILLFYCFYIGKGQNNVDENSI